MNFVVRRNETDENVTKSSRETVKNRTNKNTKRYSKSEADVLTQCPITNTYINSSNVKNNLTMTYNTSKELMQLSMDEILNNNTNNATTEALRNLTWVQQALRNECQAQQEDSLRNQTLAQEGELRNQTQVQEEILRNQTRVQKEEELRNQTRVQAEIFRNQTRETKRDLQKSNLGTRRNPQKSNSGTRRRGPQKSNSGARRKVIRNQTLVQEEVLRNQTRVQEEEILRNQTRVQGKMLRNQTLAQEENVLRNQSWAEQEEEQKENEVKMYYFNILSQMWSQMWQYISQEKVLGNQTQAQQEEQKKKDMIMYYLKNIEWVWQNISQEKAFRNQIRKQKEEAFKNQTCEQKEEAFRNQTREQKEEAFRNETWIHEEQKKEEKRMYYFKISIQMWKYIPPVIIVLGTVGNTLSILVMLRKQFRHTTMSFHLIALAIADTLALYCGLLPICLDAYLSTNLGHSIFLCKMRNLLVFYVSHTASWILVCLTLERFVAVIFPHYCRLFTKARAAIILAFIILILLIFDLHFFWTFHLQEHTSQYIDPLTNTTKNHTTRVCWVYKEHEDFLTNTWPWIDLALFSLLPFMFIIIGNISICIKLGLTYYNRRKLGSSTNQSQNQTKLISTSIVLGSVSLIFVVSTLPVTIWQLHMIHTPYNEDARAKIQITGTAIQLLQYLNNAFNFVLYCLTGRQFRKELIIMLTRIRNRIHPTGGPQNNGDTIQMSGITRNQTENSQRTNVTHM